MTEVVKSINKLSMNHSERLIFELEEVNNNLRAVIELLAKTQSSTNY